MKIKIFSLFFALSSIVMMNSPIPAVVAQGDSGLHILSMDDQSILVEFVITDFTNQTTAYNGHNYDQLVIPDTEQTTSYLPRRGTLLGVPTTGGLSLEIVEADYETLTDYHLYTGSDSHRDRFEPTDLATLGKPGHLRDQAVAQLSLYPVQYNPVRQETRLYRRLVVRLSWASSTLSAASARNVSPAYESMLEKTLANYSFLNRPQMMARQSHQPQTSPIQAQQTTNQLKIMVNEDGLYQVSQPELVAAGFDLSQGTAQQLTMMNQGQEIPIYVAGEADSTLDETDYLLFYGQEMTTVYTTTNVYWLSMADDNGQRMAERTVAGTGSTPTEFPITVHAEEDTSWWDSMPNGEGQDHWFWQQQIAWNISNIPATREYEIELHNLSTTATTATLRLFLHGRTQSLSTDPDHKARVYVNNEPVDDGQTWDGQTTYLYEVQIPHSRLQEGINTIKVEAMEVDSEFHQFYVNWIELDYTDTYVAENDQLTFKPPTAGKFQFQLTGFSNDQLQVFDITNPANVALITSSNITSGTVQFTDEATADTFYLALADHQHKSVAQIVKDQPSSWKSSQNGADYIIITHSDFYSNSLALANHHQQQGLRVATVKVVDLYDEFGHGIFTPYAIQDFLKYAYQNWTAPAPEFVLLVGDANVDYRNNYNTPPPNYIPTQLIETDNLGQTPSDNWFVQLEGEDVLPEMFIGRLAGQQPDDVQNMIDKIVDYATNPPAESWRNKLLLVADDGKDGDGSQSFVELSDSLIDKVPFDSNVTRVYAKDYPPGNLTQDIVNQINQGSLMVNYSGHGGIDIWGKWDGEKEFIFTESDIPTLDNQGKLPFVTVANCLNGYFATDSGAAKPISMAELFMLQQNKGAVAVWAPTGLDYPAGHQALMNKLYETFFQDDIFQLGPATSGAKAAVYSADPTWEELVETFILFGDPATRLGVGNNAPYVTVTVPENEATGVSATSNILIRFNKPMNPATVQLDTNGTTNVTFTSQWSPDNMTLFYTPEAPFDYGKQVELTITGQDERGNALRQGPAPLTWTFTTAGGNELTIGPNQSGVLSYTNTAGSVTSIVIPTEAVSEETRLVISSVSGPVTQPDFAKQAFLLSGYQGNTLVDKLTFTFNKPVTMTLNYADSDIASLQQESLLIRYLDEANEELIDAANTCDPPHAYTREPENNRITVPVCKLGEYSLFKRSATEASAIYLPLVLK